MQSRISLLRIAALALLVYALALFVCRAGCFVCPAAPCIAGGGALRGAARIWSKESSRPSRAGKGWKRLRARGWDW